MKNVVSYSLFWCGKDEHALLYTNGLRAIVLAHHNLFPGWTLRIHHDGTLTRDPKAARLIRWAEQGLVELRHMGPADRLCEAMLWRMSPVWDEQVSYVLCRDTDSLLTGRDRRASEEFFRSGAALHCLNDHVQHGAPIMGGMCSFHAPRARQLLDAKTFEAFCRDYPLATHGDDQLLLRDRAWPALLSSLCEHRISGREFTPGAVLSRREPSLTEVEGVKRAVLDGSDKLVPFLGCPGFDPAVAEEFFQQHGSPHINQLVFSQA